MTEKQIDLTEENINISISEINPKVHDLTFNKLILFHWTEKIVVNPSLLLLE